jgi:hypothetical protein
MRNYWILLIAVCGLFWIFFVGISSNYLIKFLTEASNPNKWEHMQGVALGLIMAAPFGIVISAVAAIYRSALSRPVFLSLLVIGITPVLTYVALETLF